QRRRDRVRVAHGEGADHPLQRELVRVQLIRARGHPSPPHSWTPDTLRARPTGGVHAWRHHGTIAAMLSLILRLAAPAADVWVSPLVSPGIDVNAGTTGGKIGPVGLVAIIFGVVNAVIKPIVKLFGCGLYVLTLGLIALVVNGALFLLTSWIAGKLD